MITHQTITVLKQPSKPCQVCHARDLCLSSCLNQSDLSRFNDIVGHHSPLSRGQRLFMAGDKIKSLFVLHSGSVKTYIESTDGDCQITGFHLPGDVIGIHGIEKQLHSDTVEALETSSVCELHFTNFDDIVTAFPSLQPHLMRHVFREMSHEQTMLLVLGKMSAERRLAYFLLNVSSRLSRRGLSAKMISLSMTRHDIANHLGLAVETVSRIFTRFQKAGIIKVQRRLLEITDPMVLQAIYQHSETDLAPNQRVN